MALRAAAIHLASLSPERIRAVATRIDPALGEASQTLNSLVARIIDARIRAPHEEPSDLLDLLLAAGQDEQPLSRAEIQDEVMTLVLTGHETTTHALTFTLALLSRNPAAYKRMITEVDDVLAGRDPQATDVDALPWTQAVVNEALRLYPPGCYIIRDAAEDDHISVFRFSPATPSHSRRTFCTAFPNFGPTQKDSTRDDSYRTAHPPIRDMHTSHSAPAAASALARVWPSWR